MNQSIISVRYAKALMLAGADNQNLDAIKSDMELIGSTIKDNEIFKQVLDNPVVKPPQKRKVMSELLEKRINPLTLNFINLIIRNRRESLLADMTRDFIYLYEKTKGIKRAYLASAADIDNTAKQQLQQQLNALFAADVQMVAETNPDLIGGFIFRVGDQQYDASLSSALKRMKKEMMM